MTLSRWRTSQQAIEELQWVEYSARNALQVKASEHRAAADAPALSESVEQSRRIRSDDAAGAARRRRWRAHTSADCSLRPMVARLQERTLRVGRIIVGRTPDNDLQIDSRFVSRHHCQIVTTSIRV